MRKTLMLLTFIFSAFFAFSVQSHAEEVIVYPFDSIRITSAFKFEIFVEEEPLETSILYGQVSLGETVIIYVGYLEFIFEGEPASGSGSIMIVTNELGVDLARWLINSSSSDLTTTESRSYASWITIDPDIGVIKDFTNEQMEIGFEHNFITNAYTFFDNAQQSYAMVNNSLVIESDLDILVSACVEVISE